MNGEGERTYLGWSTFSEQTINSGFLTQANTRAWSGSTPIATFQVWPPRV